MCSLRQIVKQLRSIRVALIAVPVMLVLSSCMHLSCEQSPTIVTGEQAELVDRSLLTHSPCSPPCWQGITPGETSEQEALTLLEELEFVKLDSLYEQGIADSAGGGKWIAWNTVFAGDSYRSRMTVDSNGIVSSIGVVVYYEITLDELIQVIGDPDGIITHVRSLPDGPPECISISVIWFSDGLAVAVPERRIREEDTSPLVTPDSPVLGASYFPPVSTLGDYINTVGSPYDRESFVEWTGFQ